MLLVGIVGLPGSGKTTVARLFSSLGAHMISGDRLGHELLCDGAVRRSLVELFGRDIVEPDGSVSRERLGDRAVASEESLRLLNDVVHPLLLDRLAAEIVKAEERDGQSIIVVDAALLPEWGIEPYFDLVVYIDCPPVTRLDRLRRAGRDSSKIRRLERFQLPEEEKRRRCHIVLINNGTLDELQGRATALYRAWTFGTQSKGEIAQCQRKLWTG